MKNNRRAESISFLKGLLMRTRSIHELVNAKQIFFIRYDALPDKCFLLAKDQTLNDDDRESPHFFTRLEYSTQELQEIKNDPKYSVTVIRIVYQ
jgi:hypothetical protein